MLAMDSMDHSVLLMDKKRKLDYFFVSHDSYGSGSSG